MEISVLKLGTVFLLRCWALEKHKVPTKYITLIKDMYNDATTFVRTCDGNTTDFSINIGLHQGSALSPYLFVLVMDEVTRDIQGRKGSDLVGPRPST